LRDAGAAIDAESRVNFRHLFNGDRVDGTGFDANPAPAAFAFINSDRHNKTPLFCIVLALG
jgi:hypothetical protein